MAVRGIGFDYLGVTALLPAHDRDVFEVLGDLLGLSAAIVKDSYERHNHGFMTGKYSKDELWRLVAADLGKPDQFDAIIEATQQGTPVPDQAVLDLADRLRDNGYAVGLLSNLASGTDWDAALYEAGVDRHFDAVVLSGNLGVAKPDPRAFKALADALDISTDEMVFIDDRESSLTGVESIGVKPIIYRSGEHGLEELIIKLKGLNIKV